MASFNIFRKGSSSFMSGILNVLGMAVAFAAFYIILVQVDYDLNFNKGIKDSEKVFVMSSGSMDGDADKRQLNFCRPLAEIILEASPNIEFGGILSFSGTEDSRYWIERDGVKQDIYLGVTNFSGTALEALGVEVVSGSIEDLSDTKSFAISESIAEKFDLEIGMSLGYEGYANLRTIKAIFKDLPENSHFADVKVLRNLGDDGITNFSEWGNHYFLKVYDPSQIKDMEESLASVTREYLMKDYFGNFPSAEEMGMTQEAMDEAISTFLTMAEVQFMPLEGLYYASNISTPIERGSKTTTVILIIVALLIVCIAFINYINFFFAQIPERIRAVNTKKVLGRMPSLVYSITQKP